MNTVKRFPPGEYGAHDWISFRRALLNLLDLSRPQLEEGIQLMVRAINHANDDVRNSRGGPYASPDSKYEENLPEIYWRTYAMWSSKMESEEAQMDLARLGQIVRKLMAEPTP